MCAGECGGGNLATGIPERWAAWSHPWGTVWWAELGRGEARFRGQHWPCHPPAAPISPACSPYRKHFWQSTSSGNLATLTRWASAPQAFNLCLVVIFLLPELTRQFVSLSSEICKHKFSFLTFLKTVGLWSIFGVVRGDVSTSGGALCPWKLYSFSENCWHRQIGPEVNDPTLSLPADSLSLGTRLKLALTTWQRHAFLFFLFFSSSSIGIGGNFVPVTKYSFIT